MSWKFFRPSFRPNKNFRAPFLQWKLWVNPIVNHVNLIFTGKFVVIFFQGPLWGSKLFRATFLHQAPPYKCLWMVPKKLNPNLRFTQQSKPRLDSSVKGPDIKVLLVIAVWTDLSTYSWSLDLSGPAYHKGLLLLTFYQFFQIYHQFHHITDQLLWPLNHQTSIQIQIVQEPHQFHCYTISNKY